MLYNFSLVLSGVSFEADHEELADKLFEAGLDEAMICGFNDNIYLEVDTEGDSYRSVVIDFIKRVEGVDSRVSVESVDAGDLVGLSDIGRLSELSRQAINNIKSGRRGAGKFPCPVQRLAHQPLWRWSEVAEFLEQNGRVDKDTVARAKETEALNITLELRNSRERNALVHEMLTALSSNEEVAI